VSEIHNRETVKGQVEVVTVVGWLKRLYCGFA